MIVVYSSQHGDPYPYAASLTDSIRCGWEERELLRAVDGLPYTIHEILRAAFVHRHHEYPTACDRVAIRDLGQL